MPDSAMPPPHDPPDSQQFNGRSLRKKSSRQAGKWQKSGRSQQMKAKAKAPKRRRAVWRKKKGPEIDSTQLSKKRPFRRAFRELHHHIIQQPLSTSARPSQLTFEAFPLRHSFRRAGPDHLLSPPATTPHQRTFAFALAVSTHHLLTLVIDSCIAIHPPSLTTTLVPARIGNGSASRQPCP